MSIARIQIDFVFREDGSDDLSAILEKIGDLVVPVLDPHDATGNCTRWVQIRAYDEVEDEYEAGAFDPDDDEDMEEYLREALDKVMGSYPARWRAAAQWN